MNNNPINNKLPNQIDSSQFIIELQLYFVYCLESIYSFIKSWLKQIWRRCLNCLHNIYINSALYRLFFTIKTYSLNNKTRRNRLMEWIQKKLPSPYKPNNFNTDWCDGICLCALCESIVPGCCPRYDLLNPSYYVNNLKLALCLIKNNLNIQPDITEKEIYECKNESKLVHLLSQMKMAHTKMLLKSAGALLNTKKDDIQMDISKTSKERKYFDSFELFFQKCTIKGMGLTLGVRSRRARFSIHYGPYPPEFSFIMEIIGPNNSFCSERIEVDYNENLSSLNAAWKLYQDEVTQNLTMQAAMKVKNDKPNLKIPFFCELMEDYVLVTYIPLFAGEHRISIIWQGRNIIGSPYYAIIEETDYLQHDLNSIGPRFTPGLQYPLSLLKTNQNFELDEIGTVVRKKTIKKSIIIKNKEYDYYTYLEKQKKLGESSANSLRETKSNTMDSDNNQTVNQPKTDDINKPSSDISIQSNELEQTNKENETPETNSNQITNESETSTIENKNIEISGHGQEVQTEKPTIQENVKSNTLKYSNGQVTTAKKIRSQKSFNASALKQMLTENNESFAKELNEMAKNIKDKLKRHKKT